MLVLHRIPVPVIVWLLLTAGPVASVQAHPHIFVEQRIEIRADAYGIVGVAFEWVFDEAFSAMMIQAHDRDGNGTFDPAEAARAVAEETRGLAESDYFTHLRVDGEPRQVRVADFAVELIDGIVVRYRGFVPCRVYVASEPRSVQFGQFDPSYYARYDPAPSAPIRIAAPAGAPFAIRTRTEAGPRLARYAVRPPIQVIELHPADAAGASDTAGDGEAGVERARAASSGPGDYLGSLQRELRARMADLAREVGRGERMLSVLLLLVVALAYGIVHALGPGHGKALAAAYLLARGGSWRGAVLLGHGIAFAHGASGVLLVLVVRFLLARSLSGASLEVIDRVTRLVSYSLIVGIGLAMLGHAVWHARQGRPEPGQAGSAGAGRASRRSLMAILAIGLVPCPAAIMLLLLFASVEALGLGVVLVGAQSLGMALTISLVGVWTLAGRRAVLGTLARGERWAERLEHGLETGAAACVTLLGAVLLIGAL